MISRKRLLLLVIMAMFLVGLTNIGFLAQHDISVTVTFLMIGALSLIMLVKNCRKLVYSTETFFWLYVMFFLFVAPYIQYQNGKFPLSEAPTMKTLLYANIIILLFLTVFCLCKFFKSPQKITLKGLKFFRVIECSPPKKQIVYILLLAVICLIILSVKGGLIRIATERIDVGLFKNHSSAVAQLLLYSFRNIISFSALIAAYYYKATKKGLLLMLCSFMILLLGCSPAGMPRFQTATVYLGLLIMLFPKCVKNIAFIYLFLCGLVLVFPFLTVFRRMNLAEVNLILAVQKVLREVRIDYLRADYDSYVILLRTIAYTQKNGFCLGKQLVGALLFFIPRGFWSGKPVSSATIIQNGIGVYGNAANVSCCIIAEGWIDFGIVGVIGYAVVLAFIARKIDREIKYCVENQSIKGILYYLAPPLIFFLMRGSFMSVWAFIVSYMVVGSIILLGISNRRAVHGKTNGDGFSISVGGTLRTGRWGFVKQEDGMGGKI